MSEPKGKFLVDLVHNLSHRDMLFLMWAPIVGFFIYLMMAYQKKMNQRNFRDDSNKPPSKAVVPVSPDDTSEKQIVKKD